MKNRRKIRVGIVGVGNWARYGHLPALRLLPEYKVTAVSSRSKETAEKMANHEGIPYAFDTLEALVNHPEVDLVVALTPAPQHAVVARAAIDAGKDIYCEWPLTTSTADSLELLSLAQTAGVKHVVALQRRAGASARYLRDLLADDFVGRLRSVRMHVSIEYFGPVRPPSLAWPLGSANFSHLLSIYGGHFMDMLFYTAGKPKNLSAIVATQFPELTLSATGESFPNDTPDGVLVIGELKNGALFSIQIEGGKWYNSGLQIDITGTDGDLKVWNRKSFGNQEDNIIEGGRGESGSWKILEIPQTYQRIPASSLDVSVQELAHLYAAFERDQSTGNRETPDFTSGVEMHRLIDKINQAFSQERTLSV